MGEAGAGTTCLRWGPRLNTTNNQHPSPNLYELPAKNVIRKRQSQTLETSADGRVGRRRGTRAGMTYLGGGYISRPSTINILNTISTPPSQERHQKKTIAGSGDEDEGFGSEGGAEHERYTWAGYMP